MNNTSAHPENGYTIVIGLEVHAQLLTQSKIFAADATTFGAAPNTQISAVSLAHPGTLPKLNKQAVELAIRMGLACGSEISRWQVFDRKNYFYPDLPKGYQITQDRTPICKGGSISIQVTSGEKKIPLNRIHLEEDAGKSIHAEHERDTLIDLNRASVPLIEIVTEPALHSAEEAGAVLAEIRKLVRYLEICDGNMEEGSLRCDANVSLMPQGSNTLGKKVEIKNMNSIRNVQRAIDAEVQRQRSILDRGEQVISETRLYDVHQNKTFGMRTKEELNDYRYFPDPDLSPLVISEEWLQQIQEAIPALPQQFKSRLIEKYNLPEYDAQVLTDAKATAVYFEQTCQHTNNYKAVSNWMMGPVKSFLNEKGIEADQLPIKPVILAELIALVDQGKLSFAVASQRIFPELVINPAARPEIVAQQMNLIQDSSVDSLEPIVDEIIKEFPLKVEEYHNGKKAIITMFMGEVMKRSKGKADPKVANQLLAQKLLKKK